MSEFFRTTMGRRYYEVTMPMVAKAIRENNKQLEIANILKMVELNMISIEDAKAQVEQLKGDK